MIHRIYSDLPTFKNLSFREGLNILLSERSEGATDKQTRNRAGKSSLVEIINLLNGGDCRPKSIFRHDRLVQYYFGMEADFASGRIDVRRTGSQPGVVQIVDGDTAGWPRQPEPVLDPVDRKLLNKHWKINLADIMFGLKVSDLAETDDVDEREDDGQPQFKPAGLTFRNLYPYFARRAADGAFLNPFKFRTEQKAGDQQMALMFLLGLDWTIAQEWENVRRQERIIQATSRSGIRPPIAGFRGTAADLRTLLAVRESEAENLTSTVRRFSVLENYPEMEEEASRLTIEIGRLTDENVMDRQIIAEFRTSITEETPPSYINLRDLYEEAGVALPGVALRAFEEVDEFHRSVVANRKTYLEGEIRAAEVRVAERSALIRTNERRKSEILSILAANGALDQLVKLNTELTRIQNEVQAIRAYLGVVQENEKGKAELGIRRGQLLRRLQQNYEEQSDALRRAVVTYEEISRALYEKDEHGLLVIGESENGPTFDYQIHGRRSSGISTMQVFCFDMMLMVLCAERRIGPGYLIHDSHIFDSADLRHVAKALKIGAELSHRYGFQYIVTINSDQLAEPQWFDDFDVDSFVLEPRLTDKTNDGGLFGFRFA